MLRLTSAVAALAKAAGEVPTIDERQRGADSGTDQLTGLAGKMTIVIEGSKHSYEFEYTLGAR